jgi:hypothetical protein
MTCTCPTVRELVRRAIVGEHRDVCPVHRPGTRAEVPPLALNDDDGLARHLAGALGLPVTLNGNGTGGGPGGTGGMIVP